MTVNSRTLLFTIGLIVLLIPNAFAHTYLSSVVLGGQTLAEGDCVRPHPATAFDSPISLVSSSDMTCGFLPYSAQPANRKCPIAAGSSIGIVWHHNSNSPADDIIDPTHMGPVNVYLAKSDNGAGNVWFKIYQDGYHSDGTWATDTMIANKGLVNVKIPSDIAPGNYLLRGEVIALHNGYAVDGAQPYVGCVELTISGSGSANPAGVAFPGAYVNTNPGLLFNLYQSFTSYPIPGPPIYVAGSASGSGSSSSTSTSTPTPTKATAAPISTTKPSPSGSNAGSNAGSNTGSGSGITLTMNSGSNMWWLGVSVVGGSKSTVKVEIKDYGNIGWSALTDFSYAYIFDQSKQLTLPISVRVTASDNSQVTFTNVFTSFSAGSVNTGKDYGTTTSSTPAPTTTTRPVTPTPTTTTRPAPPATSTIKPTGTTKPSSGADTSAPGATVGVTVYPSASDWWFAVTVQGIDAGSIASVEVKDSGSVSNFALMTHNPWGYALSAQGRQFVAPLTVRVTNTAGKSVTATVASISANTAFRASGSL